MKIAFFLCLSIIMGCAHPQSSKDDAVSKISLSSVEHIALGSDKKEDLVRLFGRPTMVVTPLGYESWIYSMAEGQRAAFTLENGIVVGAMWIPMDGECSTKDCILSHFAGAQFKLEKKFEVVGKNDKLSYLSYDDSKRGISASLVNESGQISAVTFSLPSHSRMPATPPAASASSCYPL